MCRSDLQNKTFCIGRVEIRLNANLEAGQADFVCELRGVRLSASRRQFVRCVYLRAPFQFRGRSILEDYNRRVAATGPKHIMRIFEHFLDIN